MLMKDRFKQVMPEASRIKRFARDGETAYWEVYGESGSFLGYGFYIEVPEALPEIEEPEEIDKYEVLGIAGNDYEILAVDISPHAEGPENLWVQDIVEPDFRNQYLGLHLDEIEVSPDGKIDSITDGTLSSRMVTDAIRDKLRMIIEMTT